MPRILEELAAVLVSVRSYLHKIVTYFFSPKYYRGTLYDADGQTTIQGALDICLVDLRK